MMWMRRCRKLFSKPLYLETCPVLQDLLFKRACGATLRLFINGTQEYSTTAWSISDTSADLNIGRSPEHTARLWDGLVDDVRIWNYGRTAAEITANKDAEVPCAFSGLIAYWKFNNDATDCTGSGFNATP